MRFMFLIFGFLLATPAYALDVPAMSPVNSPYIQEVFNVITTNLSSAAAGTPATCTAIEKAVQKENSIASLRSLFSVPNSTEPARDLSRTACFAHDLTVMERVLAELVNLTITSAADCNGDAEGRYRSQAIFLWEKIQQVRSYGLDLRVQVPITGTGSDTVPLLATSASDDALCPYNSEYAPTGIAGLGCQEVLLSTYATLSSVPATFLRETALFDSIVRRLHGVGGGGLTGELSLYRGALTKIWKDAEAFVTAVSATWMPRPLQLFEPVLLPFIASNMGESGCFGWPADGGGVVTGNDISLQTSFPGVLTHELEDAFTFLRMREEPKWREYLQDLQQKIDETEGGDIGYTFPAEGLNDINREHVARESRLILTIRDPQSRMANLANNLHASTRAFVAQAVNLTGSSGGDLPPLREFVGRFTAFLSGMCANRGCNQTLLRAYELSLRDECFPHFRMSLFFQMNPSASTLSPCRAQYAE